MQVKERRFTHTRGFGDNTVFVSFFGENTNGRNTRKDGTVGEMHNYTLEDALKAVERGQWKEITAPLESLKFRVADAEQSKMIQEKLFQMGYAWNCGSHEIKHTDKPFLYAEEDGIGYGTMDSFFMNDTDEYREVVVKVAAIDFEITPRATVTIGGKVYDEETVKAAIKHLDFISEAK